MEIIAVTRTCLDGESNLCTEAHALVSGDELMVTAYYDNAAGLACVHISGADSLDALKASPDVEPIMESYALVLTHQAAMHYIAEPNL